jgi:hypothetical protein
MLTSEQREAIAWAVSVLSQIHHDGALLNRRLRALKSIASAAPAEGRETQPSCVTFIVNPKQSIDEVLPVDRRFVISKAIGLVAGYRNCEPSETKEVMQSIVDYLHAALAAASTKPAEGREDALCDSAYCAGLQQGFSFGQMDDNEGLARALKSREGYVKVLRENRTSHDDSIVKAALQADLFVAKDDSSDVTINRDATFCTVMRFARMLATAPTMSEAAIECLRDVVSHHANIVAGFSAQRKAAEDANDGDDALYWKREIDVAHRMRARALAELERIDRAAAKEKS